MIKHYTNPGWEKYGLSIHNYNDKTDAEIRGATRQHNIVQKYLDSHPETRALYKADQTGKLHYYNVLALAEKELELK